MHFRVFGEALQMNHDQDWIGPCAGTDRPAVVVDSSVWQDFLFMQSEINDGLRESPTKKKRRDRR